MQDRYISLKDDGEEKTLSEMCRCSKTFHKTLNTVLYRIIPLSCDTSTTLLPWCLCHRHKGPAVTQHSRLYRIDVHEWVFEALLGGEISRWDSTENIMRTEREYYSEIAKGCVAVQRRAAGHALRSGAIRGDEEAEFTIKAGEEDTIRPLFQFAFRLARTSFSEPSDFVGHPGAATVHAENTRRQSVAHCTNALRFFFILDFVPIYITLIHNELTHHCRQSRPSRGDEFLEHPRSHQILQYLSHYPSRRRSNHRQTARRHGLPQDSVQPSSSFERLTRCRYTESLSKGPHLIRKTQDPHSSSGERDNRQARSTRLSKVDGRHYLGEDHLLGPQDDSWSSR